MYIGKRENKANMNTCEAFSTKHKLFYSFYLCTEGPIRPSGPNSLPLLETLAIQRLMTLAHRRCSCLASLIPVSKP